MGTIITGGDDYEVVATLPPDALFSARHWHQVSENRYDSGRRWAARFVGWDRMVLSFSRTAFSHF